MLHVYSVPQSNYLKMENKVFSFPDLTESFEKNEKRMFEISGQKSLCCAIQIDIAKEVLTKGRSLVLHFCILSLCCICLYIHLELI